MTPKELEKLADQYRRLSKQCEEAKEKLDNNDFDDLAAAERAYSRLHKKMWAARCVYLSSANVFSEKK